MRWILIIRHPVSYTHLTPVLALSDVGIAMGGLGCDAAIETADVVIQTDQPSKVAAAIKIGKQTHRIVLQKRSMAFGVKFLVLLLGAGGMATMWEAIFAEDVYKRQALYVSL